MGEPERTVRVDPSRAPRFLQKAEGFLRSAEQAMDLGEETSAAVLAIHAVISACDAATVHALGLRSAGQRHLDVISLLERLPATGRAELEKQVQQVLRRKNFVEYDDGLLPRHDSEELLKRAQRIVARVRTYLQAAPRGPPRK